MQLKFCHKIFEKQKTKNKRNISATDCGNSQKKNVRHKKKKKKKKKKKGIKPRRNVGNHCK